jgi:hypothetical protein
MGLVLKKSSLPYTSLIFNYKNYDNSDILYNNTGLTCTILSNGPGILNLVFNTNFILQGKYCVIVTPIHKSNNHSICVDYILTLTDTITLICNENGNNNFTDDGFDNITVQINFFPF